MLTIFVINLEERKDRWSQVLELFGKYFRIERVDAEKHNEGWKGCFLSHKKCLQIAKERNLKNIIVMEDDCIPFLTSVNKFAHKLRMIKEILDQQSDWDIVLGGVFSNNDIGVNEIIRFKKQHLIFLRILKGFCTHLMFYNRRCYDFFLNHPLTRPIDHVWQGKLKAYVPLPFLANQRPSYSNISKKKDLHVYKEIVKTNFLLMKKLQSSSAVIKMPMKLTF
jgi:GR25 family glycosyltransferase involved in LPS biosynthesis